VLQRNTDGYRLSVNNFHKKPLFTNERFTILGSPPKLKMPSPLDAMNALLFGKCHLTKPSMLGTHMVMGGI
jgi:hypothetical protein